MTTRRKRADLFMVCSRSANKSVADLQIVYRSSTDYLQIICRMSAEYLQNICMPDLQIASWIADVLPTMWILGDGAEQTNCRRTADTKQTSNTNHMLFILKQRNTFRICFSSTAITCKNSVDSYSDDSWNLIYLVPYIPRKLWNKITIFVTNLIIN